MNEVAPKRDDPRDDGPEELDDVDEVSGGYTLPNPGGCIPPVDDPFRDYTDPLGDGKHLEL